MAKKNNGRMTNSLLNFVTGYLGQFLISGLKFVTRTVFISTLGKSYLGINGLFTDILKMLALTELGLDTAMNFRLYKPLAEKQDKDVRLLLKFYRQAYTVIGFVILGLGILLIPLLPMLIKDYASLETLGINAVLVFVLHLLQSVSSYLFFAYRSCIIKADQKSYILNTVDMGITVLTYATEILILIFLKNFILYTASGIIFHILKNFINAFIAQKMYPQYFIKEEDNLPKEEIKSMFKDCGALFVYKINGVVTKATDNLVLSTFLGLGMVALYSNYLMFYTTIRSFISRFYTACKASMGNLFVKSEISTKYFFFEVMNFLSVVLFGTACVGVGVVADEFIYTWIGNSYMIEQPFAILMGIEILFVGIKFNLSQVRQVSGAFRQMWMRPVLGIVINLVVSIALVNIWGIHGVLVGTIAADVLANFMVDPRIIHKAVFKNYKPARDYYKKNLTYFAILAVIEIIDFVICKNFFVGFGWWSVIVHSCICAVSVVGTFLVLYWNTEVTKYLWDKGLSILGKKFRKFRRA